MYGYVGQIGNEFVFVIAKNIADAADKFELNSKGKSWEFDSTKSFKIIN